MATPLRRGWLLLVHLLLAGALGCRSAFYWVVMPFVYREAPLPEEQIVRDLLYRSDPGAEAVYALRGAPGSWRQAGASRENFDRDARGCIDESNDTRVSAASARYSSRQNASPCC